MVPKANSSSANVSSTLNPAREFEQFLVQQEYQTLLVDTITKIRESLNLETILKTAALQTRQLLNADSVEILRLVSIPNNVSYITVSSTFSQMPKSVNENVLEPNQNEYQGSLLSKNRELCLKNLYNSKQVVKNQAIADIYEAELSESQIATLKNSQIRASLIVPLGDGDSLWGLLCIFQHAKPRQWQEYEIEGVTCIAKHLVTAIEQVQLLAEAQSQIASFKETETLLLKNQSLLQDTVANLPIAVFQFRSCNGVWTIDYISDYVWELAGIAAREMIQDIQNFLALVHPDDLENYLASVEEVIIRKKPWFYEGRLIKPSGEIRWWQGRSTPIGVNEEIIFCGVLLDITERKQAEIALQQFNEELEHRVKERTAALLNSEARFQKLAENVPGMIYQFRLSPDGSVSFPYVSSGCYELYELLPQEIHGNSYLLLEIIHADDCPSFYESVTISAQTLEPWFWEGRVVLPSGKIKWLQAVSRPEKQADGSILWDGVELDISSRKAAEAALRESEAKFRSIIENANDLIFISNLEGEVSYISPSYALDTGYSLEEMAEQSFLRLIHPEDLPICKNAFSLIAGGKASVTGLEYRFRYKDGNYGWFSTNIAAVRDIDGQVLDLIGIARDITALKKAHKEQARYMALLEAATDIIAIADAEGHSIYLNKAGQDILGIPAEKGDGLHISEVMVPSQLKRLQTQILPTAIKQGIWSGESIFRSGDGREMPVSQVIVAHKGENGEVEFFSTIARDITARKQAEILLAQQAKDLEQTLQELERTQAQMIQSEKMSSLGQMVAGVAHEINNPVNFIHGNVVYACEYIEDILQLVRLYQDCYPNPVAQIQQMIEAIDLEFIQEDLAKLLNSMKVGTQRIREIVQSLRTFSRLDEAECKTADIHEGIDSTLMILNSRLKAQPTRPAIKLIQNYGQLPLVECYPGQLNQVFMNVLVNAIDALEDRDQRRTFEEIQQNPSTICITTELLQSEKRVRIRIGDNGFGIPESIKNRIFDPFFTTKAVGKGTGLGMSISYQIITERHRGTLSYTSSVEHGTEFVIQIPITQQTVSGRSGE
ncbi:hypothetical protein NUACC21_29040 [Scytonema sp. NUACC21]